MCFLDPKIWSMWNDQSLQYHNIITVLLSSNISKIELKTSQYGKSQQRATENTWSLKNKSHHGANFVVIGDTKD